MLKTDGVGDWNPPIPDKSNDYMSVLQPNAKDNPDALNGTNVLKNFVGKAGAGSMTKPLGLQGRDHRRQPRENTKRKT